MEDTNNMLQNFEEVLKKNAARKPILIYKNNAVTDTKNTHSPQDIISRVTKQLKDIQKADVSCSSNQHKRSLDIFKTSTFVPMNMLPQEAEVPETKHAAKFETQFVSDTQLIDIVDNAEVIARTKKGLTQEFDNVFNETDIEDKETNIKSDKTILNNENDDSDVNIVLNEVVSADNNCSGTKTDQVVKLEGYCNNKNKVENKDEVIDTQFTENCTEMFNECMKIEDNIKALDEIDIDIPSSYIFEPLKPKSKTPSPLVFDLNIFESFENMALPIMEENKDFNIAKHLINSQILGKELVLQADKQEFNPLKEETSPVLKISKNNLRFSRKTQSKTDHNANTQTDDNQRDSKANESFLKDEILFSSDEECEYIHKDIEDLPLTCALETSFYDQPADMLDKTMYVGFQTASNRSIQISSESLTKARSMLECVDKEISSRASLSELVDICDSVTKTRKPNQENNIADTCKQSKLDSSDIAMDMSLKDKLEGGTVESDESNIRELIEKEIKITDHKHEDDISIDNTNLVTYKKLEDKFTDEEYVFKKPTLPDKRKFDGFITASNKRIKLSDQALERCKKVFQDIDLEQKYITEEKSLSQTFEIKSDTQKIPITKAVDSQNIDKEILNEFANDMSIDKEEYANVKEFGGFKTASNKNIKISETALAKTKSIFEGIDLVKQPDDYIAKENKCDQVLISKNDPKTKDIDRSPNFVGFKTASKKDIKISKQALAKTKDIFSDLDTGEMMNVISTDVQTPQKFGDFKTLDDNSTEREVLKETQKNEQTSNYFIGFKTASNKVIKISEEAYSKTKNIFNNIVYDDDEGFDLNENDTAVPNAGLGFKNTDKELEEVNKIQNEISDYFDTEFDCVLENKYNNDNCSLKTTVNISDECAAKTKKSSVNSETSKFDLNKEFKIDNLHGKSKSVPSKTTTGNKIMDELDYMFHPTKGRQFLGFQTASNKQVKISDDALVRTRNLFKDLYEDDSLKIDNQVVRPTFGGFKTANNKEIKISADSLAKSKALFRDMDEEKDILQIKINSNDNLNTKPTFVGFQTVSKKPVTVSVEAMAKSKELFKDLNNITDFNSNDHSKNEVPVCKGFHTANEKPIKISAQALAKSKALFKDIDDDVNTFVDKDRSNSESNKLTEFRGFQTANNKPIKISVQALAKSKAVFQDIDIENTFINKEEKDEVDYFKRLERKPVDISEEPLAKITIINQNYREVEPFQGFQTANKKPITVSEEAIAKSKALLKDIDDDYTFKNKETAIHKDNVSSFKGFQTASKKPVVISAEALAKSKALFEDIDMKEPPKVCDFNAFKFQGFHTANSKPVSVSKEALLKSKKVFENIDSNINESILPSKFGFQTASKKKVDISEQALIRSKQLLGHCKENFDAINHTNSVIKTQSLLKTGNNNDIEVSEDALIESRKILSNLQEHQAKLHINEMVTPKSPDNQLCTLIDTQVIKNFDQTLNTEDFCKAVTPRSKRSGSPILSCPKAKKRKKFETPYRNETFATPKSLKTKTEKLDDVIFSKDYKKNKMITLRDLAEIEEKDSEKDIDPYIKNFTLDRLLNFEFSGKRNDLNNDNLNINDVKKLFITAVNKKLIPDGWIDNHLKMILWKLLSYEIKFPNTLSYVCSVKNVLDQLKYRYDKELYNAERPALRKVLEKDDVPSKTMVLCVAAVYEDGICVDSVKNITSSIELQLTDGWYSIKACIDKMLAKLVYDGKIVVGTKLVINGAELVNCEQGVAPWEDTSLVRLKIYGNSTRRARWDARLGYHGNAAILSDLASVRPEGGKVPRLRLYVARVYPALFVEKFEDGSTVTRSERLEHIYQNKYEMERQAAMEKLYEEVEKELSDQESQDSEGKRSLECPSQLTTQNVLKSSYEERSNKRRERVLQNIQKKVQEKLEKYQLDVKRNVVPLLKIRVAGVKETKDNVDVTKGLMSIWKPNDDLSEIVREGAWIEVMNVVPTAVRYSEIQISAGRQSVFKQSKYKENSKIMPYVKSLDRKCYTIKDLAKNPIMTTDYNEVDTVGFIFLIDPSVTDFESSKQPFQNVYLTDSEKNIICVNFWGGLKKFGFQNILDTGQIVACVNLQKRAGNTRKSIPQYRVTEFSYFTKTPKGLDARNMVEALVKNMSVLDKRKFCDECRVIKDNFSAKNVNENISPYRFKEHNLTKNKMFIDSPLLQKPNKIDENLNLTGLDFESTFKQTDTQELSPNTLLRKKRVNEKIQKLKMYGEPPALSPIHIINKSKSALYSYKSPLATKTDNVASAKNNSPVGRNEKISDIQSSPIIMNRTFVKSVNPVKLNFNVHDNSVDDFSEEFDDSPPLSLD